MSISCSRSKALHHCPKPVLVDICNKTSLLIIHHRRQKPSISLRKPYLYPSRPITPRYIDSSIDFHSFHHSRIYLTLTIPAQLGMDFQIQYSDSESLISKQHMGLVRFKSTQGSQRRAAYEMDEKIIAMVFGSPPTRNLSNSDDRHVPSKSRSDRLRDRERCVISDMMNPSPFELTAGGIIV